jgi:hypothetical protein
VRDQLNRGVVPEDIDVHCLASLIKVHLSSTLIKILMTASLLSSHKLTIKCLTEAVAFTRGHN